MKYNELKLMTLFINGWSWQILAIIFLCFWFFSFNFNSLAAFIFKILFVVLFIFCEYMSFIRRGDFYDGLKDFTG